MSPQYLHKWENLLREKKLTNCFLNYQVRTWFKFIIYLIPNHCMKRVHIWSYSDLYFPAFGLISPYLVWMRENTDHNNSEYGHSSRSVTFFK